MRSNKSRMLFVGITLLMLSAFSAVLHADDSHDANGLGDDVVEGDSFLESGDVVSIENDGTATPVTSVPVDTQPAEDTEGSRAKTDSGDEEDLYYKFSGVSAPKSPVSKIKGSFETDLFTGSASYFYGFEVPKGTNDLTPSVFLSYNSQGAKGRAGVAGLGWDMGLSYVQRNVNYTPDDLSNDYFSLVLNGQGYDLIYNPSENRFHSKIESFLYVENRSGSVLNQKGAYWLVRTKDGTKYSFGSYNLSSYSMSEVMCTGRNYVWRWYLDEITDTHGNKINYFYNTSSSNNDIGTVYLKKIEYNNDKSRIITFGLENTDRPDMPIVYDQGCKIRESRRLKEINVSINSTLVRKYVFNYSLNPAGSRSLLSSITECGSDGLSCLPGTRFNYSWGENKFEEDVSWDYPEAAGDFIRYTDGYALQRDTFDINRDSLPDYVSVSSNKWKVYSSNGSRFNDTYFSWNTYDTIDIRESSIVDGGIGLAASANTFDINGDGFPDYVVKDNTHWDVYFNNGTGFNNTAYIWATPGQIYITVGGSKVRNDTFDLNGDGLPDYVAKKNGYWNVFFNNGTGFNTTAFRWSTPGELYIRVGSVDVENDTFDINGDGLPDYVSKTGSHWHVFFNNGSGFDNVAVDWDIPETLDNLYIRKTSEGNLLRNTFDINGDGLPDYVTSQDNLDYWNVYFNNGPGFNNTPVEWSLSIENGVGVIRDADLAGSKVGIDTFDINGDGLPDRVKDGVWLVYSNGLKAPDLLIGITNSLGGTTNISYVSSALFDNTGSDVVSDLGFPMVVVSSVIDNNNLAGVQNVASVRNFSYLNGLYDYADKEFRGFGNVKITYSDGSYSNYSFHQDDARKGRIQSVQLRDKNGAVYSSTVNDWVSVLTSPGYYNVFLVGVSDYTFDGWVSPKVVSSNYSYDAYGNVVSASYLGDTSQTGDEKYVHTEYSLNTSAWIVDRTAHSYLTDSSGRNVSESWFFYDGHSGVYNAPTKGDLTKERHKLGAGFVETVYEYYSYGPLRNLTDAINHSTFYQYEGTYTYPVNVTNAKSQSTIYVYDFGTGNLLSTLDPNGYNTSYVYDVYGRVVKEIRPYDSVNNPSANYTYDYDGRVPEGVKVSTKEDMGSLDVYQFVDGFGRLVQNRKESEDPLKQIVENVFYDSMGRVEKQYAPYNETSSTTYTTPQGGIRYVQYAYDPVGRLNKTINTDGNYSTKTYNRWNVTVTDEKGRQKNYYFDAYQRVYRVEEKNGAEIYSTTYNYSTRDELIKITDVYGNVFSFGFDGLGRKINMTDPDMGTWLYSYDLAGNLKTQRDNRNVSASFAYDALNRVTRVNYSDGSNATYYYDKDSPYTDGVTGTLTRVAESSGMITRYYYDQRLRKSSEQKTFENRIWITNWTYDSMDREKSVKNFDGAVYYTSYNSQGGIENITGAVISAVAYDSQGKITRKNFPNSDYTTLTYDPNSFRLRNIFTSGNTGTRQNLSFGYDAVGNINSITDAVSGGTQTFQYDGLDRLTYASEPGNYTHTYSYNAIGNMLSFNNGGEVTSYSYSGPRPHAMTDSFPAEDQSVGLAFHSPTQANGTSMDRFWTEANVSIATGSLDSFRFNWNGANLSVYDRSLKLDFNFNNNPVLGESSSKAVDSSFSGINGTITGGSYSAGKFGRGLYFGGNGYASVVSGLGSYSQLTVMLWYNGTGGAGSIRALFAHDDWNSGYIHFHILTSDTVSLLTHGSTATYSNFKFNASTYNQWHHIAVTYDTVAKKELYYIDGVLDANASLGTANSGSFTPGKIGSWDGTSRFVTGTIDEFKVYNRVLGPDEISKVYNSEFQKYNGTEYRFYINVTNLSSGTYSYYGWANDSYGNSVQTDSGAMRHYTYAASSNPLAVAFQPPTMANGTVSNRFWTEANVSISTGNLDSFRFNLNGTNYTFYDGSLVLASNYNNNPSVGDSATVASDVSRYNGSGYITGASWSSGRYGRALGFNGVNNYVDYGNPSNLNVGQLTLEAWFKVNGSTGSFQNIAGKSNYYWILLDSDLKYYTEVHTPSGYYGQGTNKAIKVIGEWIHVALTYGGPSDRYMRLYENGQQIWSADAGGSLMDQTGYSFRVGESSWIPYPFNGSIDEVRVYNRSLSPTEIWLHYQSELQRHNSSEYRFYAKLTDLSEGTYSYLGWANNSAGASNRTDSGNLRYYTYLCDVWSYDVDSSCYIDLNEATAATIDYGNGLLSLNCTERVLIALNNSIRDPSCGGKMAERGGEPKDMSLAVSLISFSKDFSVFESRPVFGFKVSGYTLLYPCTLYVNGSVLACSYAMNNTDTFMVPVENLKKGGYDWYVECSDFYSLKNRSVSGKVYVGYEVPSPMDLSGLNASWAYVTTTRVVFSTRGSTTTTSMPVNTTTSTSTTTSENAATRPDTTTSTVNTTTSLDATTILDTTTTLDTATTSSLSGDVTTLEASTTLPFDSLVSTTTLSMAGTTSTQASLNASEGTTSTLEIEPATLPDTTTTSAGGSTTLETTTSAAETTVPEDTTASTTSTTMSASSLVCWDESNRYLYVGEDQYRKFCMCASGLYGFSNYSQFNGSNQAFGYVNTSDNLDWSVVNRSCDDPVYRVQCNMSWYLTNESYEVAQ